MKFEYSIKDLVPRENISAYQFIYAIEVGLRELIILSLNKTSPKWWKQRLPPDLVDKLKTGLQVERNVPWMELIPHA